MHAIGLKKTTWHEYTFCLWSIKYCNVFQHFQLVVIFVSTFEQLQSLQSKLTNCLADVDMVFGAVVIVYWHTSITKYDNSTVSPWCVDLKKNSFCALRIHNCWTIRPSHIWLTLTSRVVTVNSGTFSDVQTNPPCWAN